MNYLDNLKSGKLSIKKKLDSIIHKYKCQPVGDGYIDIIVHRKYYKLFLSELTKIGILVNAVSWWQHCPTKSEVRSLL